MSIRILQGDCRDVLPTLPAASVHCIVTSPPYFGLRDYGTGIWQGGEDGCDHKAPATPQRYFNGQGFVGERGAKPSARRNEQQFRADCGKCGATRTDSQIGLELTPAEYVAQIVGVMRECRRVLRDDGTVWLNLGDSYAGGGGGNYGSGLSVSAHKTHPTAGKDKPKTPIGLKQKDLIGIPWRCAFALQADGWWLRQDIIWAKPNPMPESVTDRCTKAHEYLFLLSKSATYHCDMAAIQEPANCPEGAGNIVAQTIPGQREGENANLLNGLHKVGPRETRNKRSVWTVATQPYSEAHFATFPPALIEPCIKAGTSEKGCCGMCGAPWGRIVQATAPDGRIATIQPGQRTATADDGEPLMGDNQIDKGTRGSFTASRGLLSKETIGWAATCDCGADPVPCTVLDPFGGAGTTGLVADGLQRSAILIELNPTYAEIARARITNDSPLFADVLSVAPEPNTPVVPA